MKIRIYFNYCLENSINLAFKDFNINNAFQYNQKEDKLYFYSNHKYYTIKEVSKYINAIIFNTKEFFNINFDGIILGTLPQSTDVLQYVLQQIKKEE